MRFVASARQEYLCDLRAAFLFAARLLEAGGTSLPSSFPYKSWLLLALIFVAPAAAQQPLARTSVPTLAPTIHTEPEVALDELIHRALKNNPQLPIARQHEEAARERVGAARAFPNPTLELVPRLIGNREAADEEMILSQPLDLFGRRRARTDVAAAELRAAQAQSTLAERSLIVSVKNAAADLFAAQEAENLGSVQVEVAQLFRDAAARRAELGDVPPVQAQRAELELLRVQNELTHAQAERLERRATLNQIIGQTPETPLRVTLPISTTLSDVLRLHPSAQSTSTETNDATGDTLSQPAETASSAEKNLIDLRGQILPDALANRPDIVGAQATLEAQRAQTRVLARERLPQVALQVRRSSVFSSGSTALRAVITMPLFDLGSNKHARRALEAEAHAQEAQIALLQSQTTMQVEHALIRLQQQQQTVERYRSGLVPQTLDLLRKTQIGYAQGASSYLEVLEAQRTLRAVQTEYLQALVGTRTSEAALESALGTTPSPELLNQLSNLQSASTPSGNSVPFDPESIQ